jgi:hypothetical protein
MRGDEMADIAQLYHAIAPKLQDATEPKPDVKSDVTRKHPVYRIKKKLMKAVHGIDIREVA